jgi:hypothetical protein
VKVNFGLLLWIGITGVVFFFLYHLVVGETSTHATSRENNLVQFISLAVGVVASFVFGRLSARAGANAIVQPFAESAVRRLQTLATGLQQLGGALNEQKGYMWDRGKDDNGLITVAEVEQGHAMLLFLVEAQIQTAADAIEDWRQFAPDDVEAIEEAGKTNV